MADKPTLLEVEMVHPNYQLGKAGRESWSMWLARWSDVGARHVVPLHLSRDRDW